MSVYWNSLLTDNRGHRRAIIEINVTVEGLKTVFWIDVSGEFTRTHIGSLYWFIDLLRLFGVDYTEQKRADNCNTGAELSASRVHDQSVCSRCCIWSVTWSFSSFRLFKMPIFKEEKKYHRQSLKLMHFQSGTFIVSLSQCLRESGLYAAVKPSFLSVSPQMYISAG